MKPRKGKFLIVDDDPVALEVARERLERAGHTVVTRESPIGTTAAIFAERPDVVLLDVNMPALQGPALAEVLKTVTRVTGTNVVLFSASDRATLAALVAKCGAAGAVQKTEDGVAFVRELVQFLPPPKSER